MKRALILLAIGATSTILWACASAPVEEPGTPSDQAPPVQNATPPQDQENLRNILRERPN